jgi:hypothetical protein
MRGPDARKGAAWLSRDGATSAPWPEAWYPFDHDTIDQALTAGVYVIGTVADVAGETVPACSPDLPSLDPAQCLQDVRALFSCKGHAGSRGDPLLLLKRIIRWWVPLL